jgi:predicted ribosome quality control (RQC) complex YloA/Tae2 family protein
VLEAVLDELRPFVGGKVQGIRQPDELDVAIGLYSGASGEGMLFLSCHPEFFRAHLIARRPPNQSSPPQFLSALRSRIDGGRLADVRQIDGERVLELEVETPSGRYVLIAELMGKHSNLILVHEGRVLGAAKWVGRSKSSRPILPGIPYERPPVMQGPGRRSRFYEQWVQAGGDPAIRQPVLSPGFGAYPASVAPLGLPEVARPSVSSALEQHFAEAVRSREAEALRGSLLASLERVVLAREVALEDLRQAEEAGGRAPQWQRWGELILAYGPSAPLGSALLQAWDYDGSEVAIKLDPELDFKDNANRYFEKAKRAKGRLGVVREQIVRLGTDLAAVRELQGRVQGASELSALRELRDEARKGRWLTDRPVQTKTKEERPYEGHRIRELLAPGGFTVLYGENAEANDYLTLRVARPNDLWLHVRGGVSSHVVIQTRNHPEKVQKETLVWAAEVAVRHSPSKHSGYVPVDYTLRKYVRKPRGAPKGTALYTHEKTLHVDLKQ